MAPNDLDRKVRIAADARDGVAEIVDGLAALDRMAAGIAAMRFQLVDDAQRMALVSDGVMGTSDPELTRRAFRAELASALRIPEPTAERLCSEAESLVHDLPATLEALKEGRLSERHARVLVDHLGPLQAEDREAVERIAIPLGAAMTVAKFDRRVRTLRERRAPEQAAERHRTAREDRDVSIAPGRDGMAWRPRTCPQSRRSPFTHGSTPPPDRSVETAIRARSHNSAQTCSARSCSTATATAPAIWRVSIG